MLLILTEETPTSKLRKRMADGAASSGRLNSASHALYSPSFYLFPGCFHLPSFCSYHASVQMTASFKGEPTEPSWLPYSSQLVTHSSSQIYSFLPRLVLECELWHWRGHFLETGPLGIDPARHLTSSPMKAHSFPSVRTFLVGRIEAELGFQPRNAVNCSCLNPELLN